MDLGGVTSPFSDPIYPEVPLSSINVNSVDKLSLQISDQLSPRSPLSPSNLFESDSPCQSLSLWNFEESRNRPSPESPPSLINDKFFLEEVSSGQPLPISPLSPPPFAAETTAPGPKFTVEYLKALINGKDAAGCNYAIFWQYSDQDSGRSSLLRWGHGYYEFAGYEFSWPTMSEEQDRRRRFIQDFLPVLGWSPHDIPDYDITDNLWFFVTSVTKSFEIFVDKGGGFSWDQQLCEMMSKRAEEGEDLGLQTVVFMPVADGVVELGSSYLTPENSDLIGQVMGLLNRFRGSLFPYLGHIFHRGEAIRCSLNVERVPKRAHNERENHEYEHNSLKRQLAGKEKISGQILEQPWPMLTESSVGNNDTTSCSNSVEFSGPS